MDASLFHPITTKILHYKYYLSNMAILFIVFLVAYFQCLEHFCDKLYATTATGLLEN
jgi:hypothetical protein